MRERLLKIVLLGTVGAVCVALALALFLRANGFRRAPDATVSTADYLFYVNSSSDPAVNGLHRMDPDGGNDVQLCPVDEGTFEMNFTIAGDRLYVVNNNKAFSINADGTGKFVYDGSYFAHDIAVADGTLYLLSRKAGLLAGDYSMYAIDCSTGKRKKLKTDTVGLFSVYDGGLYLAGDGALSRYDLTNGTSETCETAYGENTVNGGFDKGVLYYTQADDRGAVSLCSSELEEDGTVVQKTLLPNGSAALPDGASLLAIRDGFAYLSESGDLYTAALDSLTVRKGKWIGSGKLYFSETGFVCSDTTQTAVSYAEA